MEKRDNILNRLRKDESGQALLEFVMLMIASVVAGFIIMIAMRQVVDALYGLVEEEVARPSHF